MNSSVTAHLIFQDSHSENLADQRGSMTCLSLSLPQAMGPVSSAGDSNSGPRVSLNRSQPFSQLFSPSLLAIKGRWTLNLGLCACQTIVSSIPCLYFWFSLLSTAVIKYDQKQPRKERLSCLDHSSCLREAKAGTQARQEPGIRN